MRKAVVVLGAALVASLAALLWLWRELHAVRADNAALIEKLEHSQAPYASAADVTSTMSNTVPAPASPATISSPAMETGKPLVSRTASNDDDWEENQRRLLRDPKYRDAWKAQYRLNYTPRRENAIRLLGFTPAQADAWLELQIELDLARVEAAEVDEKDNASVRQRQELMDAAERHYQDQTRALVGDIQYEKLQQYMESRGSRLKVDRFRNQLGDTDALRDDQVEPLITALHAEEARMMDELNQFAATFEPQEITPETQARYGERQVELLTAAHKRMRTSASAILTGAQLKVLDAMFKREEQSQLAQQKMNAIQAVQANPAN